MSTSTAIVLQRLEQTRAYLKSAGLSGLIVTSSDPHVSENPSKRWKGREWLSGFTGSIGVLVVLEKTAALFTNAIYEVQAASELKGTGIEMIIASDDVHSSEVRWISQNTKEGSKIAIDGSVVRLDAARKLIAGFEEYGLVLQHDLDLIDEVWSERPGLDLSDIFEHKAPYASQTRGEKLSLVRDKMAEHGASHHLVSSTDDIAWITNLRGGDVPYNPLFASHLVISPEGNDLFVLESKLSPQLIEQLAVDQIRVHPYEAVTSFLAKTQPNARVLVDPKRTTYGIVSALPEGCSILEAINPTVFAKSQKTDLDLENYREAMAEDGAAMCEFYAWFENELAAGRPLDELTVHQKLTESRLRRETCIDLSFHTIAGFNPNAAMPHYMPTEAQHDALIGNGMLLIDSGGQYLGGTTDITRTWPIGNPTREMKRDYSLVLKGVIALSRQRFPKGTLSTYLDSVARGPIWNAGIDYGHGTGHGVGYFLCVHEGPHTIRKAPAEPQMAMLPGMVTSVEPAIYRVGQWGVRTENLVVAVPCQTGEEAEFGDWLEFETLTLCPIETSLIDREIMHVDEIAWLNRYHKTVRERLADKLNGEALDWLLRKTEPIAVKPELELA